MMGTRIAAFAILALVAVGFQVVPVGAQRPVASAELPATVEALIFELANSMGMLRGRSNQDTGSMDSILTLEHWASGSLSVGDQRFDVPEYRMSFNFSYPGMRVDYTRAEPTGASERRIEVVSGDAAWNETERGMNASGGARSAEGTSGTPLDDAVWGRQGGCRGGPVCHNGSAGWGRGPVVVPAAGSRV